MTAGPTASTDAALRLERGRVSLTRVTIRGFATGVAVTAPAAYSGCDNAVMLTDSAIIDNEVGIDIGCGDAYLVGSVIVDDPLTAPATIIGVDLDDGSLTMRDRSRIEVTMHAIRTSNADCGGAETNSRIDAADAVIIGGETGIDHLSCQVGGVTLRRSVVRGGTIGVRAACFDDLSCLYDLSGGNDLQVTSPDGYALIDARSEVFEPDAAIQAVGSTLNGRSYGGQRITGPAQAMPDYRIVDNGAIQF